MTMQTYLQSIYQGLHMEQMQEMMGHIRAKKNQDDFPGKHFRKVGIHVARPVLVVEILAHSINPRIQSEWKVVPNSPNKKLSV
jgi:hypothetical protein